jgi:O-antigen biosynthesis protein
VTVVPVSGPVSVAVVICTYTSRRLDLLLAAVESVREQASGPDADVLVVVDHNDDLCLRLRNALPEDVRVLSTGEERGLSGARNSGWRATTADVVVFLDDDAALRPGALAALRDRMADGEVVAVGGAVHPSWEGGHPPFWFPEEYGWVVGCDYRGLPPDGADIRNPIGACMAVRRNALTAVGGFSVSLGRVGTLPVGCEETLMGIGIRHLRPDARIVRDERFAVDHVVPADRQRVSYFVRRCFHEGRSKALLAQAVGRADALSSERTYVLRVLMSALVRDAARAVRGRPSALAQAAVVVVGLAVTTVGLLSVGRPREPAADRVSTGFSPGAGQDRRVRMGQTARGVTSRSR